jgi:hypothetical protein
MDHFVQEKKAFNFSIICKYQYFVIVFTYFEVFIQFSKFFLVPYMDKILFFPVILSEKKVNTSNFLVI